MCIAFWLLDKHPAFWLILALNRDEFHARPTLPFHFWDEDDDEGGNNKNSILGGKDLRGGGTWMGITTTGRLAFLTNVREQGWNDHPERTSRGNLPTRFLKGAHTPRQYAELIAEEGFMYNGFNLLIADCEHGEMAFVSNRHGDGAASASQSPTVVRTLTPGLHSVSNGTLDGKWPKMERGKKLIGEILLPDGDWNGNSHGDGDGDGGCDGIVPNERIIETVLRNSERADDVSAQLAETHLGEDFETPLSSIFVEEAVGGRAYGTRSMTVVGIRRDGQVSLFERYLESGEWKDHSFQFRVKGRRQGDCAS